MTREQNGVGSKESSPKTILAVSEKLTQDIKDSTLDSASDLVEKLEQIKEQAANLPGKSLDKFKEILNSWKETLKSGVDDPEGLATGDMAICQSWYSPKVESKLQTLLTEYAFVEAALLEISVEPFRELFGNMRSALVGITPTVRGLMDLPKRIQKISEEAEDNSDSLRKVDTKTLKKSLDTAEMYNSLETLARIQQKLPQLIEKMERNLDKVSSFVSEAPGKIKAAFDVPPPCCWMTPYIHDQSPLVLMDLLKQIDQAAKVDLQAFSNLIHDIKDHFSELDTSRISKPVKKFTDSASERLDRLEKVVISGKHTGYCLPPPVRSRK